MKADSISRAVKNNVWLDGHTRAVVKDGHLDLHTWLLGQCVEVREDQTIRRLLDLLVTVEIWVAIIP